MTVPGFDGDITPENLTAYNDGNLLRLMAANPGGVADTWARQELDRRRMASLTAEVSHLTHSSKQLESLTNWLIGLTIALLIVAFAQTLFMTWDRLDKWEAQQAIKHFWIL